VKLLRAIRVAYRETRRALALEDWQPSEVYVWPTQLSPGELNGVALECGLRIVSRYDWSHAPGSSRWKLTLDKDADGTHHAGVAICVNDDNERAVIVLERA
jgi:hypothetical protein